MENKIIPFSQRTNADIFLEYKNDWLTVEAMADNYGRTVEDMRNIISKGREEHESKFYVPELIQMVIDLQHCIERLCEDRVTQFDRDREAQWIGEAHELLFKINPEYCQNKATGK